MISEESSANWKYLYRHYIRLPERAFRRKQIKRNFWCSLTASDLRTSSLMLWSAMLTLTIPCVSRVEGALHWEPWCCSFLSFDVKPLTLCGCFFIYKIEAPMGLKFQIQVLWLSLGKRKTDHMVWQLFSHLIQFSCSVVSDSLQPHELQHTRPPCLSPTPRVHSDSRPSSQWCHPVISSSVVPFSSCPQSLPASQSFPMSQLFAWGGQSSGVSALASFLPKKSQGWSPSEWTGWISLQSKGLSRVFSKTTVQKH